MTKPTQCSEFKRLWYQLMGVNLAQDLVPVNPKKIMSIKQVSMFRRPLGMQYLPTGDCWNVIPVNRNSGAIDNLIRNKIGSIFL